MSKAQCRDRLNNMMESANTVLEDDLAAEVSVSYPRAGSDGEVFEIRDFSLWYGTKQALFDINMKIQRGLVTALIGPSGCGKSTLLRSLNRMNDLIDHLKVSGEILLDGNDIYQSGVDVINLRKQVGMVFQKPNPFPKTIFENVAYGLRVNNNRDNALISDRVTWGLRHAALWDEVKDRLHESALGMSGGQQQRLCIARALAVEPEVLLMDEPCSALDPLATAKIEDLIGQLRGRYTIVIVTHSMQQAARVSDNTAFMYLGKVIEYGDTETIFTRPKLERTSAYITGRFG